MNKTELIKIVAEKTETTIVESTKMVNAMLESIMGTLKEGGEVSLVGFGTFKVVNRAERKSRNPQTGEEIVVPATKVPTFKVGKSLKELVK